MKTASQIATILLGAFLTAAPVFQTTKSAQAFWWSLAIAAGTGIYHLCRTAPKDQKVVDNAEQHIN